jgi:hypothetical protein
LFIHTVLYNFLIYLISFLFFTIPEKDPDYPLNKHHELVGEDEIGEIIQTSEEQKVMHGLVGQEWDEWSFHSNLKETEREKRPWRKSNDLDALQHRWGFSPEMVQQLKKLENIRWAEDGLLRYLIFSHAYLLEQELSFDKRNPLRRVWKAPKNTIPRKIKEVFQ